jgi:hypothetical protein
MTRKEKRKIFSIREYDGWELNFSRIEYYPDGCCVAIDSPGFHTPRRRSPPGERKGLPPEA